ncbi:NADH-quinone oxidoreductase subunit A [Limnoglobus roseus]|uniref:NADH-quinone oxidoreductase subunit A n=1 Tax=Limnoglobus roseus TaxID=2598579 RepID=A0A5C1AM67_9BACT|nr:NADH-quinone oxidoreductase subunit A [Limnoglobus roseus]QEL20050.1 NADH dehydrogenase [Limnoglobus roseus]
MTALVVCLLVFVTVGAMLLSANLVVGWFVRPDKPTAEKGEAYECGEEPVGPAWVQFDLRFYVVALLFVIFDVEIAFFFPWAVVFGSANQLADPSLSEPQRVEIANRLTPGQLRLPDAAAAQAFAQFAFFEMLVFFAILLVGFAYLWKRGDLEWVRSLESHEPVSVAETARVPHVESEVV